MRIVGGQYRGRRLAPPHHAQLRPTTDRAREALFSILNHTVDWPAVHLLDLFSGSGAIALEALSRGCAHVVAVERHRPLCSYLKHTAESWGITGLEVICQPVEQYLAQPPAVAFDLVFLDPPYAYPSKAELVARIRLAWLAPEGILVLEHPNREDPSALSGFREQRSYGQSTFSFFACPPQE